MQLISQGSSLIFPYHGVTPSLLPTADASLDTNDAIKGRLNVKTKHKTAVGERSGGVVVDDVSDFFVCLWVMDDPVVSVKWSLGTV